MKLFIAKEQINFYWFAVIVFPITSKFTFSHLLPAVPLLLCSTVVFSVVLAADPD